MLKIPGKVVPATLAPAVKAEQPAPEIVDFPKTRLLPSLALVGESGGGKTFTLGRLCALGFRLLYVAPEQKYAALANYRPPLVNIGEVQEGKRVTWAQRYDQLMRFQDKLARGGYRTRTEERIEIIAFDGATEIGDIIARHYRSVTDPAKTIKMWGEIGDRILDFFRDCRNAAVAGGAEVGIVMTCLEEPEEVAAPGSEKGDIRKVSTGKFVPNLPGQISAKGFAAKWEVVWRLSAGLHPMTGQHEYRIATQKTDEYFAKSPAGLFETVERGPGLNRLTGEGQPDGGAMYKKLLDDPGSPFCSVSETASE